MKYVNVFKPKSLQHAKDIVLTPEDDKPTKFEDETRKFVKMITPYMEGVVMDYGCGMGRVAKELLYLENVLSVVGVDISPEMLRYAVEYVNSDGFTPIMADTIPEDPGQHMDTVISVS